MTTERWTAETEERWAFEVTRLLAEITGEEPITKAEWADPEEAEARAEVMATFRPLLTWLFNQGLLVTPQMRAVLAAARDNARSLRLVVALAYEADLTAPARALLAAVDALDAPATSDGAA